jgi:DNA primase
MDLILSHQAGVTNTVAVSGTALTEEHLRAIRRLADTIVMAFDGDGAGIRAAKRAVEMALLLEFEVRVAKLPDDKDPADLVREDPAQWLAAVDQAKHVIDFYLAVLTRKETNARTLGKVIRAEVLPYVARLASRLDQAHFVKKISQLLDIDEAPIWQEVDNVSAGVPPKQTVENKPETNERNRLDRVSEEMFGLLWWQVGGEHGDFINELFAKIKKLTADDWESIIARYEPKKNQLILAAELSYGDQKDFKRLCAEACEQFRLEFLKEQLNRALAMVKTAESAGNTADLDRYLKKCQDISNQLRSPL